MSSTRRKILTLITAALQEQAVTPDEYVTAMEEAEELLVDYENEVYDLALAGYVIE